MKTVLDCGNGYQIEMELGKTNNIYIECQSINDKWSEFVGTYSVKDIHKGIKRGKKVILEKQIAIEKYQETFAELEAIVEIEKIASTL